MSDNQFAPFRRGRTWTSMPAELGHQKSFPDKDWGSDPATTYTNTDVLCVLCKNTSGGTLTRGTIVKFDSSTPALFKYVNATAGAGERGDGVVDEYVGSSGVASNAFFWVVRKGNTQLTTSTSASIAVKDALRTAASGKVVEDSVGMGYAVCGYALEAVAASATLFRAYVDFTGVEQAPTSGSPALYSATFTVGAEDTNVINIAVQLTDQYGNDLAYKAVVDYYVSTDTAGDTLGADEGTLAIGTDGTILKEHTDDIIGMVRSEADGDIDFNYTSTGSNTVYLNLRMPDGRTVQSGAIAWA